MKKIKFYNNEPNKKDKGLEKAIDEHFKWAEEENRKIEDSISEFGFNKKELSSFGGFVCFYYKVLSNDKRAYLFTQNGEVEWFVEEGAVEKEIKEVEEFCKMIAERLNCYNQVFSKNMNKILKK